MSLEDQLLSEAQRYALKRPRRVISADCENYPGLHWLFRHAQLVREIRPKARQFVHQGVVYAIVWQGVRMCVMHARTGRLLVGAPGADL
jgi:hypothetical protein